MRFAEGSLSHSIALSFSFSVFLSLARSRPLQRPLAGEHCETQPLVVHARCAGLQQVVRTSKGVDTDLIPITSHPICDVMNRRPFKLCWFEQWSISVTLVWMNGDFGCAGMNNSPTESRWYESTSILVALVRQMVHLNHDGMNKRPSKLCSLAGCCAGVEGSGHGNEHHQDPVCHPPPGV